MPSQIYYYHSLGAASLLHHIKGSSAAEEVYFIMSNLTTNLILCAKLKELLVKQSDERVFRNG